MDDAESEPLLNSANLRSKSSTINFKLGWKLKYIERILLLFCLLVIYIQFLTINSYTLKSFHVPNTSKTDNLIFNMELVSKKSLEKSLDLNSTLKVQLPQPQCKHPKLLPFHESVIPYLNETLGVPNCKKHHHLLYKVDYEGHLVDLGNIKKAGFNECNYCQISRLPGNDDNVKISSKCTKIKEANTKLPKDFEFIAIKCKRHGSKQMYLIDIFAVVPDKPKVRTRIAKRRQRLKNNKVPRLNVIIMGIDSISQMTFLRSMTKTSEYLRKLDAIGMMGHLKHGENTFENVVSVLTGQSVGELLAGCWKKVSNQFDKCPFIWKEFIKQGYITSYIEDDPQLAAFNNDRKGFKNSPVDYYFRPANFALFKHLGHSRFGSPTVCLGPRLSFDVSLDYFQRVIHKAGSQGKYFMFSWADSLTHDFLTSPSLIDEKITKTLRWLNATDHLNNTMFVLMSDHGLRHGGFSNTFQGGIETRMPMLYFLLPKWFQKRYKNAMNNLRENSHRLSTHFDIHETLLDTLHLEKVADKQIMSRSEKLKMKVKAGEIPRGISLFLPIPFERTCDNAGISEHNCMCSEMREVSLNATETLQAAESLVKSINRRIAKFPECSQVGLLQIFAAVTPDPEYITTLRITISTTPAEANFQGTFTRGRISNENLNEFDEFEGEWKLSGVISRTNIYREQSQCIDDSYVKPYCYCDSASTEEPISSVDTYELLEKLN